MPFGSHATQQPVAETAVPAGYQRCASCGQVLNRITYMQHLPCGVRRGAATAAAAPLPMQAAEPSGPEPACVGSGAACAVGGNASAPHRESSELSEASEDDESSIPKPREGAAPRHPLTTAALETGEERRMEALLQQLSRGPTDSWPNVNPRDLQFFRHIVRSGLSAPQVRDLMVDEHQLTRREPSPLTLHGMADVDKMAFRLLDHMGLRLQPHTIQTASGASVVMLLMDVGAITKAWFEDVSLAQFQDLIARVEPPGSGENSPQRLFSSMLTADWFREASRKALPGTRLNAMSLFWDATVSSSSGATYCPLMLFNNNVLLSMRYKREQIFIAGFAPVIRPPVGNASYAGMSPTKRAAWLKLERDSVEQGVLQILRQGFEHHSTGIVCADPTAPSTSMILVPVLACIQVDHPQHMKLVAAKQCGFCNVGGLGKRGLAAFEVAVSLRNTTDVSNAFTRVQRAVEQSSIGDRVAKRDAKAEAQRLKQQFERDGLHITKLQQWDDQHTDAYQNIGLSPLHILKGVYKDMVQWSLQAIYNRLDTENDWRRWLARIDRVVVRELAAFPSIKGRFV